MFQNNCWASAQECFFFKVEYYSQKHSFYMYVPGIKIPASSICIGGWNVNDRAMDWFLQYKETNPLQDHWLRILSHRHLFAPLCPIAILRLVYIPCAGTLMHFDRIGFELLLTKFFMLFAKGFDSCLITRVPNFTNGNVIATKSEILKQCFPCWK